MKAVILASGEGKRLRPLTEDMPKQLVRIGKRTLLDYQLTNLTNCNIKNITITTGPFEDEIKRYVKERYPDVNVSYVKNPKYRTTNYIYSMWLTRVLIDDNVILLHGDLLFEENLLRGLINDKHENCVLVNKQIEPPEEDFKAMIEDGKVTKIGVRLSGENAFFLAPLYKFSKSDFKRWLDEIGKFVQIGKTRIYSEDVFNEISDEIALHPLYFSDELCMEIDTKEDLETARDLIHKMAPSR